MKKFVLASLVFCTALFISNQANAAFFDATGGISQWTSRSEASNPGEIITADYSTNLLKFSGNFSSANSSDSEVDYSDTIIYSNWLLDLTNDFTVSTKFHHSYAGTDIPVDQLDSLLDNYDKVSASFVLFDDTAMSDSDELVNYLSLDAKNDISGQTGISRPRFTYQLETVVPVSAQNTPEPESIGSSDGYPRYWWARSSSDGFFTYDYDASTDTLTALLGIDDTVFATSTVENFHGTTGIDKLHVGFEAWAMEPSNFTGDQLYFSDFEVSTGTSSNAVPEPASIALLGSGLVGMFFRRKKA